MHIAESMYAFCKRQTSWQKRATWLAAVVVLLLIVSGCVSGAPQRDFPTEALLLDETAFPPETKAGPTMPMPNKLGSRESRGLTFYGRFGIANHDVYRYRSAMQAASTFERETTLWFPNTQFSGPWTVPSELSYQSSIADRFYLACSIEMGIPMCNGIAQYEEYFIRFNVHMHPEYMTYQDLERVLRAMDERMVQYLGKNRVAP
jgi:hypothetical protein